MQEYHYQGGLGDFFCYLYAPEFKNHSIRSCILFALAGVPSVFHIYSDNPDAIDLFARMGLTVVGHKFNEYQGLSLDPYRCELSGILIHPFTSTPSKLWKGTGDGTLVKIIDYLIDECGRVVVLWGKDNPHLWFGREEAFSIPERFGYERPGLISFINKEGSNAYSLLGLVRGCNRMICVDSAVMMARHLNPDQKIMSLFPSSYREDKNLFSHYYYRGLDMSPNLPVYYDEPILDKLKIWMEG